MTWVKLPDDALEDPKVADLNDAALLDYLKALSWSNRWARDGVVPVAKVGDWVGDWVTAGLATVDDDVVQLSWLLEYQPKADEIKQRRKDAADRQERHRRHMASDHSKCDGKRCLVLLKAAKDKDVTRDKTRDQRTLRPDSVPTLPEGRGEERGDGDDGPGVPVAAPRDALTMRRDLARQIREAVNDDFKERFMATFRREYGHLYGGAAA